MKNKFYYFIVLVAFCLTAGCARPRVAIKPGYDFEKIKTIGIGKFSYYSNNLSSGEMVKDEFTRQFMHVGYVVKRSLQNVEVILEGNVNQFSPQRRYLVFLGNEEKDKQVIITSPAVEIGGSNVYSLGTAFGLKGQGQILVSNATVGITARLVDPENDEILWTNSCTYEGLDIQTAVEGAVNYLVRSISKKK